MHPVLERIEPVPLHICDIFLQHAILIDEGTAPHHDGIFGYLLSYGMKRSRRIPIIGVYPSNDISSGPTKSLVERV
jgi:hypothetical protein